MGLLAQGRKYALTAIFLALSSGVMLASYVLAFAGKLTSEWVQLCTIYLPSLTAVTVGFQASNAFITGKTVAATGSLPPPPEGERVEA